MFNSKYFRYKEFTIPFAAYRGGDLSREDFYQIILELKDIQNEQHESLFKTLEQNNDLKVNHRRIYLALQDAVAHFDEAIEITESALCGDEEDEEDLFEDAMQTFKKGNELLAEAYMAIDEMSERSELDVSL